MNNYFITCAPFHEGLLLEEIKSMGLRDAKETHLGVSFSGTLKDAYRVLIWSRLAHHLLLKLKDFKATNQHALYHEMKKIKWSALKIYYLFHFTCNTFLMWQNMTVCQ
jgi:23S rRNA (guanine2445-N2)-methyltransferase / 23S rRNA (guanine2069-N7)-methyltransferase